MSSEFMVLVSGNFTAVSQNIDLTAPNSSTQVIQVTGTFVGTLIVEGSNDNSTYYAVELVNRATNAKVASITAAGSYYSSTNAWQFLRMRSSAWTSGTAITNTYGSDAATFTKTSVIESTLPTGASTSALQTTGNTTLTTISGKLPATLGQKTSAASLAVTIASDQSPVPVSASSLPLPTGASTEAKQDTGNASLSSIDSKLTSPLAVTGPLTDAQLRASPVPISGTVTANAGTNLNTSALALETTQSAQSTLIGPVIETAPASDTASSGLNGRLQRIAQRLTSLIAVIPSTIGTAFFARLSDGTDTAKVTTNQDLSVSDGLRNGGVHGALTLVTGGTTYEAKVGGSRLANRKSLTITALDDMYWGYSNTVTTATGTPLAKNQQLFFDIDPDSTFQVWLVASGNNKNSRITEST